MLDNIIGTMSEINQLRLALQDTSTARNVAEGQCISLKVCFVTIDFIFNFISICTMFETLVYSYCIKLCAVFFFLCISMSCQNFKNRSRCMKVQAGLV